MKELLDRAVLPEEEIRGIFGNLPALLDFQRKFCSSLEDLVANSDGHEQIGRVFVQHADSFVVYGAYCANHRAASELALEHLDELTVNKINWQL
jgi:cell division control protein 24